MEFLKAYHIPILTAISILLIWFSKSYFQERGKLKALRAENKILVEQTESIKSRFNRELEELKKDHQLEISKRRYKYESKKEQYINFFKLLDQFTKENNSKTQERLIPILEEFNSNYLNATLQNDTEKESAAITQFSLKMQKILFDANEDLMKIKQETSTIRLIASADVRKKLNSLDSAYDHCMEVSNKMMSDLPKNLLMNNQEQLASDQKNLEVVGLTVKDLTEELIELMRRELDEI